MSYEADPGYGRLIRNDSIVAESAVVKLEKVSLCFQKLRYSPPALAIDVLALMSGYHAASPAFGHGLFYVLESHVRRQVWRMLFGHVGSGCGACECEVRIRTRLQIWVLGMSVRLLFVFAFCYG